MRFTRCLIVTCCLFGLLSSLTINSYAADEIIVSAAASLTNAMTEIGKAFEEEFPEVHVVFNFASSGSLVQQMLHGAPVDVFASASQKFMNDAQEAELILEESRINFARNALVLAVPSKLESSLSGIEGIIEAGVTCIGIGIPESVPAGRYAKEALQSLNLWNSVQSKLVFGNTVRQILDYLRRGEVDAGLIYATDAVIGGDAVRVVEALETQTPIVYPVAITADTPKKDIAKIFIDFILAERGQTILKEFGFSAP